MLEYFHVSLLYRLLAIQLMLGEANHFIQQLNLREVKPIGIGQVQSSFVASPNLSDFTGNLKSPNYSFGFGEGGLRMVRQRKSDDWFLAQYGHWALTRSLIDADDAYRMATQWLGAVSVDLPALEDKYSLCVTQLTVLSHLLPANAMNRSSKKYSALPVYYVQWGQGQYSYLGKIMSNPAVEVVIIGTTKELLELSISDVSLSKRPRLSVPHGKEIARLSDMPVRPWLQDTNHLFENVARLLDVPEQYRARIWRAMADEAGFFAKNCGSFRERPWSGATSWTVSFGHRPSVSAEICKPRATTSVSMKPAFYVRSSGSGARRRPTTSRKEDPSNSMLQVLTRWRSSGWLLWVSM